MTTIERRPEPVTRAAQAAGAIAALLLAGGGLLRAIGVLPVDVDLQRIADAASNVVLTAAVLWAMVGPWLLARFRARDQVTPLADPRDHQDRVLLSSDAALLVAEYPEYEVLVPYLLGAGGMTAGIVRDHLETLRQAAAGRTAVFPPTRGGSTAIGAAS